MQNIRDSLQKLSKVLFGPAHDPVDPAQRIAEEGARGPLLAAGADLLIVKHGEHITKFWILKAFKMKAFFFCKILLQKNFTIRRTFVRLRIQFVHCENFFLPKIRFTKQISPILKYLCFRVRFAHCGYFSLPIRYQKSSNYKIVFIL